MRESWEFSLRSLSNFLQFLYFLKITFPQQLIYYIFKISFFYPLNLINLLGRVLVLPTSSSVKAARLFFLLSRGKHSIRNCLWTKQRKKSISLLFVFCLPSQYAQHCYAPWVGLLKISVGSNWIVVLSACTSEKWKHSFNYFRSVFQNSFIKLFDLLLGTLQKVCSFKNWWIWGQPVFHSVSKATLSLTLSACITCFSWRYFPLHFICASLPKEW